MEQENKQKLDDQRQPQALKSKGEAGSKHKEGETKSDRHCKRADGEALNMRESQRATESEREGGKKQAVALTL